MSDADEGSPVDLLRTAGQRDKALYMKRDPENPDVVLGDDLIAPEGFGEIMGGSQREDDHDLLLARMQAEKMPIEDYQWFLDLRKYGSVPHSGFGIGLERLVTWMSGIHHIANQYLSQIFTGYTPNCSRSKNTLMRLYMDIKILSIPPSYEIFSDQRAGTATKMCRIDLLCRRFSFSSHFSQGNAKQTLF
jgi:hypothetical protein